MRPIVTDEDAPDVRDDLVGLKMEPRRRWGYVTVAQAGISALAP